MIDSSFGGKSQTRDAIKPGFSPSGVRIRDLEAQLIQSRAKEVQLNSQITSLKTQLREQQQAQQELLSLRADGLLLSEALRYPDRLTVDIEKHGANIAALQDDLRLKDEQENALRREIKDMRLKNEEIRQSSGERF